MRKRLFLLLAMISSLVASSALGQGEQAAKLVSEWTLTDATVPPAWIPTIFDCPKGLRLIDELTRIEVTNPDPDVNSPPPRVPIFTDINGPVTCTPIDPGATLRNCTQTSRPLNGDVWALTQVNCSTEGNSCAVSDLRWTLTARPGELVLRRDCRNCPTAVLTGQCIYAFVKGVLRSGDGPRVGSEEGLPHDPGH